VAVRAALERAGVAGEAVDEVFFGHARQAGSGPNPARQVARHAGLPDAASAQTINKACASGLQAIVSGALALLTGDADLVVAGGMESMSRMPYLLDAQQARWGQRLGNFPLVDAMYRDGFLCPLSGLVMGQTADLLAHQCGITREASDEYALESQARARRAQAAGHFDEEVVPVPVRELLSQGAPDGGSHTKSPQLVSRDEHPRPDTTLDQLRRLPPVFDQVGDATPVVTAGTASGVTDGAAAIVLTRRDRAAALGLAPLARLTGWASAGVDPRTMGIGPVPAMRKLFARTGLGPGDFDLVELNEAFAAQVLAVLASVPIESDRLNVNGGAIALGHPIGCTGARLVVTLLHELRRRQGRYGLATLCVSGGMGMALAIEAEPAG
jgi:acetyl-CoA C-acetyltransferase